MLWVLVGVRGRGKGGHGSGKGVGNNFLCLLFSFASVVLRERDYLGRTCEGTQSTKGGRRGREREGEERVGRRRVKERE